MQIEIELDICPYCGEAGGMPVNIEDEDRDAGYRVVEQMCSLCAPRSNYAD